jgi:hypothetical protein
MKRDGAELKLNPVGQQVLICDPMADDTDRDPLALERQLARARGHLQGARLTIGGGQPQRRIVDPKMPCGAFKQWGRSGHDDIEGRDPCLEVKTPCFA